MFWLDKLKSWEKKITILLHGFISFCWRNTATIGARDAETWGRKDGSAVEKRLALPGVCLLGHFEVSARQCRVILWWLLAFFAPSASSHCPRARLNQGDKGPCSTPWDVQGSQWPLRTSVPLRSTQDFGMGDSRSAFTVKSLLWLARMWKEGSGAQTECWSLVWRSPASISPGWP